MAKQPEAKFKTKVVKVLKDAGSVHPHFVIAPNDAITRGISDLLICWEGIFIALELKLGTPVSELQRIFLHSVKLGGGLAGVLRLKDDKLGLVELTWITSAGLLKNSIVFPLHQLVRVIATEVDRRVGEMQIA